MEYAYHCWALVQAEKDRQLQAVMSRSGAYKGGFALPPSAVRQIFPPFDPDAEANANDDDEDEDDDDDDAIGSSKFSKFGQRFAQSSAHKRTQIELHVPRWVKIARQVCMKTMGRIMEMQ